ncbi:polysaccharide deacetylase family protein [Gilvimarinus polysaccharolyticus]|uniref:polysaccharide deacetylase family protein n=1 Tax=Gilvimarinus polysaccharolyticus TaxID=863921 RepID=UPI000673273F|nr:polysaccharide deacetylase family protein [Gilvimarinus polysaccharolyticus]
MLVKLLRIMLLANIGWLLSVPVMAAVILQYHHVSDQAPSSTSTSVERFKQHLSYLSEHQFDVIALPELIARLKNGKTLNDKTVVITFDDGYRSVYDTAFALLREYGFAFTVFVNSAPIDRDFQEFVTWPELKKMTQAGATIANHTVTHPFMQRLLQGETEAEWRERMAAEIIGAEEAIEAHTGQSVKLLAYPYGEFDAKLERLVQQLGYIGFGQHSGAVGPDSDVLALPRFPMGGNYGEMDSFITKVQARALPIKRRQLIGDDGQRLSEATVAAGTRPQLQLTLADAALAMRLSCYHGGDKLPVTVANKIVTVKPVQVLRFGRSRYNCTARADDGRYYWFSQPWFVTGEQGQWQHES